MRKKFIFIFLTEFLLFFSCAAPDLNQNKDKVNSIQSSYRVSMDNDGWLLVNGERFFVKGVNYFQQQWLDTGVVQNSLEITDYDFKRIKECGFNTIRTYLTPDKLEIAKKYCLMVFQDSDRLCFSNDYLDLYNLECLKANIDMTVGFSKKHDNILLYQIDNEPGNIGAPGTFNALYLQGVESALNMWEILDARVKNIQPNAFVTVTMMPPDAMIDTSMFDIICLNLYPFNTAMNSIGYQAYADWYKRSHAKNKPFIISEYGWADDINAMSSNMIQLMDYQIKAGATGSFFFVWRAGAKEKTPGNDWWGFVPFNGSLDNLKTEPRQIYYEYQKYFEAVVIEPKVDNCYSQVLPVKVYGSDKTRSIDVIYDNRKYSLRQTGIYWWETDISINPYQMEKKSITITSYDNFHNVLVSKQVNFNIATKNKFLTLKITNPQISSNSFTAKITVTDQDGNPASNQIVHYGVYQSKIDNWVADTAQGRTNQNGESTFAWDNAVAGYFHLMAGVNPSDEYPNCYDDVCVIRVE